jgi:hypothetical protein
MDDPQTSLASVPETVHLPGTDGDAFSRAKEELNSVHAEAHPALQHAEGLRKHRVPMETGHHAGPRPHVLDQQVVSALVRALFQERHPVPVPVH